MITTLEAELQHVRDEQHRLAVRGAHLQSALLRARQGTPECVVRAMLEAKNVIILRRPVAALLDGARPGGGAS